MQFSIVMPSLNQKNYIERAIQSILTQGRDDVEIVVTDGGSTDGTQTILKLYEEELGGRFRWSSSPDQGPADAVNKALQKARGSIIGSTPMRPRRLEH